MPTTVGNKMQIICTNKKTYRIGKALLRNGTLSIHLLSKVIKPLSPLLLQTASNGRDELDEQQDKGIED